MASTGAIERNNKVIRGVRRNHQKRLELKKIIKDPTKTPAERLAAQREIYKLGAKTSYIRIRNRCSVTGNPRAYHRKYKLSRDTLRNMISYNLIPGVSKASW